MTAPAITDGLIAVVKRECPACQLVVPVLEQLAEDGGLTVFTQDDPDFPLDAPWVVDDTDLSVSWNLDLDAVPTLLRFEDGKTVTTDDIKAFGDWAKDGGKGTRELAYRPARVLMQDFTGVPAVVVEGKWLISGGQPAAVFEEALRKIAGEVA